MGANGWLQLHHAAGDAGGIANSPRDDAPWILVADDELVVRDLLQRFLTLEGYTVKCAADGMEAITLFRNHPGAFRAAILDVLMPRVDGCAAFHEIRKLDPNVAVLVMSGFAPGENASQIIGRPGEGVTLKPGMFFTIEPMINLGKPHVKILSDGWTAVTRDRSLSAQFEHSVGVTATGVEIFTLSERNGEKPLTPA